MQRSSSTVLATGWNRPRSWGTRTKDGARVPRFWMSS